MVANGFIRPIQNLRKTKSTPYKLNLSYLWINIDLEENKKTNFKSQKPTDLFEYFSLFLGFIDGVGYNYQLLMKICDKYVLLLVLLILLNDHKAC